MIWHVSTPNSSKTCFSCVLLELLIYSRHRLLYLAVKCWRTKQEVFSIIDILTIAFTVQAHQIQCQLICEQNLAVSKINLPLEQESHSYLPEGICRTISNPSWGNDVSQNVVIIWLIPMYQSTCKKLIK